MQVLLAPARVAGAIISSLLIIHRMKEQEWHLNADISHDCQMCYKYATEVESHIVKLKQLEILQRSG